MNDTTGINLIVSLAGGGEAGHWDGVGGRAATRVCAGSGCTQMHCGNSWPPLCPACHIQSILLLVCPQNGSRNGNWNTDSSLNGSGNGNNNEGDNNGRANGRFNEGVDENGNLNGNDNTGDAVSGRGWWQPVRFAGAGANGVNSQHRRWGVLIVG